MRECSRETAVISSLLLDKAAVKELDNIIHEIESDVNYDAASLWKFQSSLVPSHPHHNIKSFMVPLQCARDEIEICNVNRSADYVILYCSKYLEEVIRYFLSIMHPVLRFRYKIVPLSGLLKKLEDFDFISDKLIEVCAAIHRLSIDCTSSNQSANTKDAVFVYICSLLIGTELLKHSDMHVDESEKKCLDSLYSVDLKS